MAAKGKAKVEKPADEEAHEEAIDTEQAEGVEQADEPADEEETGDSVTVSFVDPNLGLTERVFSEEVHGKGFKKLADRFCETHKDKSAQIVK